MYTFRKMKIDGRTVLAIVVPRSEYHLINFCIFIRTQYIWKTKILTEKYVYSMEELNKLKSSYRTGIYEVILDCGYALVDLATGEIIKPTTLKKEHIIEEFRGELPF